MHYVKHLFFPQLKSQPKCTENFLAILIYSDFILTLSKPLRELHLACWIQNNPPLLRDPVLYNTPKI